MPKGGKTGSLKPRRAALAKAAEGAYTKKSKTSEYTGKGALKVKRVRLFLLAAAALLLLFAGTGAASNKAAATSSNVLVDGRPVRFEAYTIGENNYFKLRDLAMALSGSAKQFDVSWDGAQNAVRLVSGKAYTPVGGEMSAGGMAEREAFPSGAAVFLDGNKLSLSAYTIGGNNYFKLRDVGAALDFGVGWNGAENTVTIDSSVGYSGEAKLAVHFLDVGQGDAELISLPNGKTMLIDAGEAECGKRVVSDLKALGVTRLDYVVATHPHADHIGGLPEVLSSFPIGAVYLSNGTATTQTYKNFLTAVKNCGAPAYVVRAGAPIFTDEGGASANVVAPNSDSYKDLNNYSVVIRLCYGSRAFLFTGDAEALSEGEISADVRADVLKVGHHGSSSSTSPAFLKKVAPRYAVIEVGADNDYGHPAAVTLRRLRSAGAAVYRTDQNGTVTIICDGTNLLVSTEK